jgi:4,5-dihydroxyphthalate decarboxylase
MATQLKLTLACGDYDRTRPLIDGRVRPEGIDLIFLTLRPEEIFWRMLKYKDFHVSEMSFSSYVLNCSRGNTDFIAIPVFISRMLSHSCIYVSASSGIEHPKDLIEKRVGIPEYQTTAAVWARGILHHEFGVFPEQMVWVTGGLEQPGREEKISLSLPASIRIFPTPPGKVLSQMLEHGEIEALISPRPPSSFSEGSKNVRRLFGNYREEEIRYYRKTNLFPIMHIIVIRRDVYNSHPWVAQSLYKAFCLAKTSYWHLAVASALHCTLPFLMIEFETIQRVIGENFWPYGLEKNQREIDTFIQYAFEQGIIAKKMDAEKLFAENTLRAYKV